MVIGGERPYEVLILWKQKFNYAKHFFSWAKIIRKECSAMDILSQTSSADLSHSRPFTFFNIVAFCYVIIIQFVDIVIIGSIFIIVFNNILHKIILNYLIFLIVKNL